MKPKARLTAPLSDAIRCYLLAGCPDDARYAHSRLRGWLTLHGLLGNDAALEGLWRTHRADLAAEARKAGFVAAAELWFDRDGEEYGDVLPPDAARDKWARSFCQTNGY